MSANTSIREGGSARFFGPITCLMVQGNNGKYCPWYPEADRALDSLSVNKNGIYQASKYNVYGWNRVSVNVPQSDSVTGKDPETGEEKTVTTDPETGELVETVVPVEIRVIEPPTNPYGVYVDGQTITKDGMVVKAYDANGNEMQTVPIGEITLVPGVAAYDTIKDTGGGIIAMLDDPAYSEYNPPISAFHRLVSIADHIAVNPNVLIEKTAESDAYLVAYRYIGGSITMFVWLSTNQNDSVAITTRNNPDGREEVITYDTIALSRSGTTNISGTEFYYNYGGNIGWVDEVDSISPHFISKAAEYVYINDIATIIFDGETTQIPAGSYQTITVSWPRPGDGAILETTFDILVGPRGGQGDD